MNKRILFTSVFGPYGKKDEYVEGLGMQMELLNNQVTRGQGVHSPRQSYLSFALYLLAENISIPSTVLDFPRWEDFTAELKNGYTHVGITFIVPNVYKVKRMTEFIRSEYPDVKIILGGYGTIIPDLDKILPYDEICRGEGVGWLRGYLGDDITAPLKHPVLINPVYNYMYGVSSRPRGSVLLTGAGCRNGCSFCITSHMFKKEYLPLLATGKDVFEACVEIEKSLDTRNFMVMDENFFMDSERGLKLLEIMEREDKAYSFVLFSSANIIKRLGVDFFVRMGITRVWIGVESKTNSHEKVKGVDIKKLIDELQSNGIAVLASSILFQDHHDESGIREEIDWVISLGSNLVQFMNYTPWPTTGLYAELESGKRLKKVDYRDQHGAGELAFRHPYFNSPEEHRNYLKNAFRKKYFTDGPGGAGMALTAVRGYIKASGDYSRRIKNGEAWNGKTLKYEKVDSGGKDQYFELRLEAMKGEAIRFRPVLPAAMIFSPNLRSAFRVYKTIRLYRKTFGGSGIIGILKSSVVMISAMIELIRIMFNKTAGHEGIVRQPGIFRKEYTGRKFVNIRLNSRIKKKSLPVTAV